MKKAKSAEFMQVSEWLCEKEVLCVEMGKMINRISNRLRRRSMAVQESVGSADPREIYWIIYWWRA